MRPDRDIGDQAIRSGISGLFHVPQVGEDDVSRRDDVSLEKSHEAISIFPDAKLQDLLVLALSDGGKALLTPGEEPVAVEVVAGAADLLQEEWPVGTPIDQRVEFCGKAQPLR